MQQIPRLPLPKMAVHEAELLGMSLREFVEVTELRKLLEPKNPLDLSQLTRLDAQLGFKLSDLRKRKGILS